MKKLSYLIIMVLLFAFTGCTIEYSNISVPEIPDQEESDEENQEQEEQPVVQEPSIEENALFYPTTLNVSDTKITDYSYIDNNLTNEYTIYSAYYSEEYDTIYIAYGYTNPLKPKQTLKAKDLYEIEKHAINYFISDLNRTEDKNYLKAVRIYPDKLASSCRKDASDEVANTINGCADYGGKEAIIDLNNILTMDDFYNEKRIPIDETHYEIHEPMRDTFAHEYGHISTFYHMVYKNDENYEDYLKLRLGEYYSTVYDNGLPDNYSSSEDYYKQPEEILADDFVELFYQTEEKAVNDKNEYVLEYADYRNSLKNTVAESIQYLNNNLELKEILKTYYEENFLDYSNKITYETPKIISSNIREITYYESISKINNTSNLKSINSLIDVNLISVGEVTINGIKYYRVILSNTFKCHNYYCDSKDVGEKMGYVEASLYTNNTSLKLYKTTNINKNSIFPIRDNTINELYILPYYDFSYVLTTIDDQYTATMYDYLSQDLPTQQYQIQIPNFLTLIEQ